MYPKISVCLKYCIMSIHWRFQFLSHKHIWISVSTFQPSERDSFNYIFGITFLSFEDIIKINIRLLMTNNIHNWRLRCSHEIGFEFTRTFNNLIWEINDFYRLTFRSMINNRCRIFLLVILSFEVAVLYRLFFVTFDGLPLKGDLTVDIQKVVC